MWKGGQRHYPATLPPGMIGARCTGGWVGPKSRSGRVRKISSPPGFEPLIAQPVASRCSD